MIKYLMMVTEIVEQTCKVSNMHMHVEAWLLYVQELQHLHFLFVNAVQNVIGLTGRNQTVWVQKEILIAHQTLCNQQWIMKHSSAEWIH